MENRIEGGRYAFREEANGVAQAHPSDDFAVSCVDVCVLLLVPCLHPRHIHMWMHHVSKHVDSSCSTITLGCIVFLGSHKLERSSNEPEPAGASSAQKGEATD